MAVHPKISAAEWEVLDVVWERAPVSAPSVHEALCDKTAWHQKTVNTFLTRLVEKGVLAIRREGRMNVYAPKLSRDQCVRRESQSFLRRVFRGATGPLLVHFCETAALSDAEIAHLRKLLLQRTKKGRKG